MTWEQKLEAMTSLVGQFNICLKMRKPGNRYVSTQNREIGGDGVLISEYGNGSTPQEAVEDDWKRLVVDLPANKRIVINSYGKNRSEHRWNGYRWETLECEQVAAH